VQKPSTKAQHPKLQIFVYLNCNRVFDIFTELTMFKGRLSSTGTTDATEDALGEALHAAVLLLSQRELVCLERSLAYVTVCRGHLTMPVRVTVIMVLVQERHGLQFHICSAGYLMDLRVTVIPVVAWMMRTVGVVVAMAHKESVLSVPTQGRVEVEK